jgi:ribosomal RNA-processing protein 7
MSTATSISGFTIIPVSYSTTATHYLYARTHAGSSKSAFPHARTLFLVNVPPDATEREISQFFKYCGTVERVEFEQKKTVEDEDEEEEEEGESSDDEIDEELPPQKRRKAIKGDKKQPPKVVPLPKTPLRMLRRTGRSCHVIFLDASSMQPALSQPQKTRPWPTDPEVPSGLAHYTALYDSLRPPLDVVREHAYTAVVLYQYQREKKKQQSKYHKGEAIVDEDGFTLVTRGGAYGKTLGGEVAVASKKFISEGAKAGRTRRKKEGKEKHSFYAFQIHERNRKSECSYLIVSPMN